MKPTRTWIVIADGARAHAVVNVGAGKGVKPVRGFQLQASHDQDRDINADRPGRTFDSHGPGRHAMEPPSSPHRQNKARFAKLIVETLDARLADDEFDKLVIVAPATTLGDLRSYYSKALRSRITSEVEKDLTHTPNNELARHLGNVLPI
ncbi:MAG TPA: host attachment protein [Hyphomicrobiaceae bacterium]|nr:host attachment protein [Hyphomicrobiaceae bacterium]